LLTNKHHWGASHCNNGDVNQTPFDTEGLGLEPPSGPEAASWAGAGGLRRLLAMPWSPCFKQENHGKTSGNLGRNHGKTNGKMVISSI